VKFGERNIDSNPKFLKDEITNNSSWEEQGVKKTTPCEEDSSKYGTKCLKYLVNEYSSNSGTK